MFRRKGRPLICRSTWISCSPPVSVNMAAILYAAGISQGPFFHPIGKGARLRLERLSPQKVALIVKAHAAAHGSDEDIAVTFRWRPTDQALMAASARFHTAKARRRRIPHIFYRTLGQRPHNLAGAFGEELRHRATLRRFRRIFAAWRRSALVVRHLGSPWRANRQPPEVSITRLAFSFLPRVGFTRRRRRAPDKGNQRSRSRLHFHRSPKNTVEALVKSRAEHSGRAFVSRAFLSGFPLFWRRFRMKGTGSGVAERTHAAVATHWLVARDLCARQYLRSAGYQSNSLRNCCFVMSPVLRRPRAQRHAIGPRTVH
jgi:hypothetical protein